MINIIIIIKETRTCISMYVLTMQNTMQFDPN